MNKMSIIAFAGRAALVAAAAVATSATLPISAADFSLDGRWLVNGTAQTLKDTVCTVNFYSTETAASPAASLTSIPLKTDSEGYFVVSANAPSSLPDTFWVGVTPAGSAEISPRFRVAPAPFALAAVEALLVTNATEIALSGTATIDRLEVAKGMTVADVTGSDGQSPEFPNLQADSMRIEELSLADASRLGLFNTSDTISSLDFDSFPTEGSISAIPSVNRGHWWIYYPPSSGYGYYVRYVYLSDRSVSKTFSSDTDGILIIALQAKTAAKCNAPKISLKAGDVTLIDNLSVGNNHTDASLERIISIPYRATETINVTISASGDSNAIATERDGLIDSYWLQYGDTISARFRFVHFGRE